MKRPCALLFDIGGVITGGGPRIEVLARILHLGGDEHEALRAAVWRHRDDYDLGLAHAQYWTRVASDVGVTHLDEETVERLLAEDLGQWEAAFPGVREMLEELATCGYKLAILSNASVDHANFFRRKDWARQVFSSMTFSSDIGHAKPEPEAYRCAVDALGTDPADVLFFDDRPGNVEAARETGLMARVWEGLDTAADLRGRRED
ncbi:MAG: HAD family phosphatase [Actinomycetaceae bacterium]|nr:HAD family phosphatase [Actinomycetaceae bacterium]